MSIEEIKIEQILTNQVIIQYPKALLVLILCALASAVQLVCFPSVDTDDILLDYVRCYLYILRR